jgi:hypothetical protein
MAIAKRHAAAENAADAAENQPPVYSSHGIDSLHTMMIAPFCMVAPHADTFDQQRVTKIGRIIEFIAVLPLGWPQAQRQPNE